MVRSVALACCLFGSVQAGIDGPSGDAARDRAAYESAAAQAGKNGPDQVRLALWCESHGLSAERMKHLAMAVLYDPANALARSDGPGRLPGQVEDARPGQPGSCRTTRRSKAVTQEYLQRRAKAPRPGRGPVETGSLVRAERSEAAGDRPFLPVLQRDPTREPAWKHLGFKKVGGRWDKPERRGGQKAAVELQHKANKHWRPLLEKWRGALASRDKTRRDRGRDGPGGGRPIPGRSRWSGPSSCWGVSGRRRPPSSCWARSIRRARRGHSPSWP